MTFPNVATAKAVTPSEDGRGLSELGGVVSGIVHAAKLAPRPRKQFRIETLAGLQ